MKTRDHFLMKAWYIAASFTEGWTARNCSIASCGVNQC
jgi:hypothetical protein